jgi:hypothetical protein
MTHAPEKGHNHNLDNVTLNYLCYLCRSQHTFGPRTETGPPRGAAINVFDKGVGRSQAFGITS